MDKPAKRAAACSNKRFTGKCIKDDTVLYQTDVRHIEKETKKVAKLLNAQEKICFESQQSLRSIKLA